MWLVVNKRHRINSTTKVGLRYGLRHLAVSFFILETSKRKVIMDVEALRKQYLPNKIKVLFIAEAKPDADDRFFYDTQVSARDYLYLNLMRALYDDAKNAEVKDLRKQKEKFLERFKKDGYYLVDAVDEIDSKMKSPQRTRAIKSNANKKIVEVRELLDKHGDQNTKVVLIKATVFDGLYNLMKSEFNIVNDFKIYFPSSRKKNVENFLEGMSKVVEELRV